MPGEVVIKTARGKYTSEREAWHCGWVTGAGEWDSDFNHMTWTQYNCVWFSITQVHSRAYVGLYILTHPCSIWYR
jgi:hypothetical protein